MVRSRPWAPLDQSLSAQPEILGTAQHRLPERSLRLGPSRAGKLLQEAGLQGGIDEICQNAQHLGVRPDAIFAIILAGLLRGPIGECLSTETRGASMPLQEFAQRAMEAIRETGDRGSAAMLAIQDAAGLNIVKSSWADETIQMLRRFTGYLQLLDHVERFVAEQNRQAVYKGALESTDE